MMIIKTKQKLIQYRTGFLKLAKMSGFVIETVSLSLSLQSLCPIKRFARQAKPEPEIKRPSSRVSFTDHKKTFCCYYQTFSSSLDSVSVTVVQSFIATILFLFFIIILYLPNKVSEQVFHFRNCLILQLF